MSDVKLLEEVMRSNEGFNFLLEEMERLYRHAAADILMLSQDCTNNEEREAAEDSIKAYRRKLVNIHKYLSERTMARGPHMIVFYMRAYEVIKHYYGEHPPSSAKEEVDKFKEEVDKFMKEVWEEAYSD